MRRYREIVEERNGFKYVTLQSGRRLSFGEALNEAALARSAIGRHISRCFRLTNNEYDLEQLEGIVDSLGEYVTACREEIHILRGFQSQRERIAALRNTTGRTAAEADEFLRKADELERRLRDAEGARSRYN